LDAEYQKFDLPNFSKYPHHAENLENLVENKELAGNEVFPKLGQPKNGKWTYGTN
jgi:hypothetical protein